MVRTDAVNEPYRPRSDWARNPDQLMHRELFTAPQIGFDGGILVPSSALATVQHTQLGAFLREKTLPVEGLMAATTNPDPTGPKHRLWRSVPRGEWLTSRGEPYYSANFGFNRTVPKWKRREHLRHNLREDAALLENIPGLETAVARLDPESKWRVVTAVYQNICNDLVGLDYAYRIAQSYDSRFAERSKEISARVFDIFKDYYHNLLSLNTSFNFDNLSFVLQAPGYVRTIRNTVPSHIDHIRTQREADATFQTLAGALSFKDEFGAIQPGEKDPPVIIPLLGGFDLGPALHAVGYTGEIHYVTPANKLLSEFWAENQVRRRETVLKDLSQQLPKGLQDSEPVIFDDSLGKGSTLDRVIRALGDKGITPRAVRTLFISEKLNPQPLGFRRSYSELYDGYYAAPIRGNGKHQSQTIFPRQFSERWLAQHKQYAQSQAR